MTPFQLIDNQRRNLLSAKNVAANAVLMGHMTYFEAKSHADAQRHFYRPVLGAHLQPETVGGLRIIRVDEPRMLEVAYIPGLPELER